MTDYSPSPELRVQIALEATARLLTLTPAVIAFAERVAASDPAKREFPQDHYHIANLILDGVKIEESYKSYTAVIPDPTTPSGTLRDGCHVTPEQALESALWHRLDKQNIPHPHSARSLTLRDLRAMSAEDLRAREQVLKYRKGNKASYELRRVHRVCNERNRIADEMITNAKAKNPAFGGME